MDFFCAKTYHNYLAEELHLSLHSVKSYITDLHYYQLHYNEISTQSNIKFSSTDDIKSYIAALLIKKRSHATINRKMSALRNYFDFLIKKDEVEKNPLLNIKALRQAKRLPKNIPKKELNILLDTALKHEDSTDIAFVLVAMLYNTGCRISEVLSLKLADFNVAYQQVKVMGKGRKERLIPIGLEIIQLVNSFILHEKPMIFLFEEKGKPLNPRKAYTLVNKFLSNIPLLKKKSPHVLRHSFATHLLDNEADIYKIKELLGHSSLATTQIYAQTSIEKLKKTHTLAHPRGNRK